MVMGLVILMMRILVASKICIVSSLLSFGALLLGGFYVNLLPLITSLLLQLVVLHILFLVIVKFSIRALIIVLGVRVDLGLIGVGSTGNLLGGLI